MTKRHRRFDSCPAHVIYTGSNAAAARDWYNQRAGAPAHETWFITRSMASSTGGQAWRYVRGDEKWPDAIRAAAYDQTTNTWVPVATGADLQALLDERLISA